MQSRSGVTPLVRLGVAHAVSAAGDAVVAVALADSLFFGVPSPDDARARIGLYLLVTMAPFALLSPLVGPAIDRHGQRVGLGVAGTGRAALAVTLASVGTGWPAYPAAFGILVLSRAHAIARNALVPSVVRPPRTLVEANASMAKAAAAAGTLAGIPALALARLLDPAAALVPAAALYAIAAIFGLSLRDAPGAEPDSGPVAWPAAVARAAMANAIIRGTGGFLLFLLAFGLRDHGIGKIGFGLVLAGTAAGSFAGAALVPRLGLSGNEEKLILLSLMAGGGAALIAARSFGFDLAVALGVASGLVTSAGRVAFDSILQREQSSGRGRAFARSETRFQLAWVAGAAMPVVAPIPIEPGLVATCIAFLCGAVWFLAALGISGRRSL